jgi:hypothetical protein
MLAHALQIPGASFSQWDQTQEVYSERRKSRGIYRKLRYSLDGVVYEKSNIPEEEKKKTQKDLDQLRHEIQPLSIAPIAPLPVNEKPIPTMQIRKVERVDVLAIAQRWNHAAALVDPCILESSHVTNITKAIHEKKMNSIMITAGVDYRPVRQEKREHITSLYRNDKTRAQSM